MSSGGDRLWIVPRFGAAPAGTEELSAADAAFQADGWFARGTMNRWALADLQAMASGPMMRAPGFDDWAARAWVREALERGDLIAYRALPDAHFAPQPGRVKEEGKQESRQPETREEKTWLVIELVDDDEPSKPVPFRKYRVELPDATVREGMLDGNGRARIAGIDPGTCKVTFPGLHGDDWRQVA
ncbi:MAG: hypothetical protein QM820_57625 [Minicystis sp.]